MNIRNFARYSRVAFAVAMVFLVLSALSFIAILWTDPSIRFHPTSQGFAYFFQHFNAPLTFLAASFAVFATWLTLERVAQTQRQLDLIGENNRFNNYYKHVEEFSKQFQEHKLLKRWNFIMRTDQSVLLLPLYREFYYRHPQRFAPRINDDARNGINIFYNALHQSTLLKDSFDFVTCRKPELEQLTSLLGGPLRDVITKLNQSDTASIRARLSEQGLPVPEIGESITKYTHLNEIVWTTWFFDDLLIFDGETPPDHSQLSVSYQTTRSHVSI